MPRVRRHRCGRGMVLTEDKLSVDICEHHEEKITEEEIIREWGHYSIKYLVQILNKEYPLDEAIEDIKSFREK